MKKTATHTGTCQCCGRRQKLPGGNLSKHGYTKAFGFFMGTCHGAHHLPLEQDRSRLDAEVKFLREEADRLETSTPEQVELECSSRYVGRQRVLEIVDARFDKFREAAEKALAHGWSHGWPRKADDEEKRTAIFKAQFSQALKTAAWKQAQAAKQARTLADGLVILADEVHGTELVEV